MLSPSRERRRTSNPAVYRSDRRTSVKNDPQPLETRPLAVRLQQRDQLRFADRAYSAPSIPLLKTNTSRQSVYHKPTVDNDRPLPALPPLRTSRSPPKAYPLKHHPVFYSPKVWVPTHLIQDPARSPC